MDSARAQHCHAAPAGCWILDDFAQVDAWRGGSGDPLPTKGWIDAGAAPEAVVFRVGEVEVAHPAFAGGCFKWTWFHRVKVMSNEPLRR